MNGPFFGEFLRALWPELLTMALVVIAGPPLLKRWRLRGLLTAIAAAWTGDFFIQWLRLRAFIAETNVHDPPWFFKGRESAFWAHAQGSVFWIGLAALAVWAAARFTRSPVMQIAFAAGALVVFCPLVLFAMILVSCAAFHNCL